MAESYLRPSFSLSLSLSLSFSVCGVNNSVSTENKLYQCSAGGAGTALYPWALGEPTGLRLMAGSLGEFLIGGKNPEGWAQVGPAKAGLSRRSLKNSPRVRQPLVIIQRGLVQMCDSLCVYNRFVSHTIKDKVINRRKPCTVYIVCSSCSPTV